VMKHRRFLLMAALCASFAISLIQADENPSTTPERTTRSANNSAQRQEIPRWVIDLFSAKALNAQYEFASALNPLFLTGDFNGDGKVDVAVLMKQRATGKLGIAIFHDATGKVAILGAGTSIGNGGDDFAWMDSWQIYSKARGAHAEGESGVAKLHGDALLVGKSESGSALIYWNGKRYVWLQEGD
jgi:hypothetical protein